MADRIGVIDKALIVVEEKRLMKKLAARAHPGAVAAAGWGAGPRRPGRSRFADRQRAGIHVRGGAGQPHPEPCASLEVAGVHYKDLNTKVCSP